MANYRRISKTVQPYRANCGDDVDDDDDVDLDDDNGDAYDGLTDYDEDLDYPDSSEKQEQRPQHNVAVADSSMYTIQQAEFVQNRSSNDCPRVLEHVDGNRKDHHNHLERKRRASIKGSYNELREAIPALRGSKASRAVTLQRAVEYIEELTKRNAEHTQCVDTLTRQNEHLDRQIQDLSRNYQRMEENEYSALSLLERGLITTISPATYNQPSNFTNTKSKYLTSASTDVDQNEFSPAADSSNLASNDAFRLLCVVSQCTATNSLSSTTSPSPSFQTQFNRAFPHFLKQSSSSDSHCLAPSVSSSTQFSTAPLPQESSVPDSRNVISSTTITSLAENSLPVSFFSPGKHGLDYSLPSNSSSNPIKAMKYVSSFPSTAQISCDSHYTTLNNVILSSVNQTPLIDKQHESGRYESTAIVNPSSFPNIENTVSELPGTVKCDDTYLVSSTFQLAADRSSNHQNEATIAK